MKVKILQPISGDPSHEVGETVEMDDATAWRNIAKGIAKATSQKAHNDLVARLKKAEDKEAETQARLLAVSQKEKLEEEVDGLIASLVERVEVLESMDAEYRAVFLGKIHTAFAGEDPAEDDQNNKGDLVDNSGANTTGGDDDQVVSES